MAKDYLTDYLEDLVSCSQRAKETCGEDTLSYYRNIFSRMIPSWPNIQALYEEYIADALKNNDFTKLHSVFLHRAKVQMLSKGASGYDHCDRLWGLLDLLACDSFDNVYRVLPEGLPLCANGYPMYLHGTNLILGILYNSENTAVYPMDKIVDKAEKFAASKKALWERSVISCLLGIWQGDVPRISDSLQKACEGYVRMDIAKYMKMQCQNVYGLVILANHFLSREDFDRIDYPKYHNFSTGYMSWLLSQDELPNNLCITYPSPVEELNEMLKKQIAITRIYQPYLNSDNPYLSARDKKAYYMDIDKMLEEFLQQSK